MSFAEICQQHGYRTDHVVAKSAQADTVEAWCVSVIRTVNCPALAAPAVPRDGITLWPVTRPKVDQSGAVEHGFDFQSGCVLDGPPRQISFSVVAAIGVLLCKSGARVRIAAGVAGRALHPFHLNVLRGQKKDGRLAIFFNFGRPRSQSLSCANPGPRWNVL